MSQPQVLTFDEISQIPLERLLQDRELQRDIHYTVTTAVRDTEYGGRERPYNPHPVVELERTNGCSLQHNTFRIQDPQNIYFFQEGWPMEEIPEYLTMDDIIGSGFYALKGHFELLFNKPLWRVDEMGGTPHYRNSRINEWQPSATEGVYKPSLYQKMKVSFGRK